MATQDAGLSMSLEANGDLSSSQYYFVTMTGTNNRVAVCNATTDVPIGVLQNDPAAAGREASVCILGSTKIKTGSSSLTAGNIVGTDANGKARALTVGTNTTAYASGIVVSGSSSGEMAEIVLFGPAISRAA